jgi:hypothetical protein
MSHMLRRPPAKMVHREPQPGPLTHSVPATNMAPPGDLETPARDLGRQTFGAVRTMKSYGEPEAGRQGGRLDLRPGPVRTIEYVWQLFQNINPAHEQPKLIFYSGAQPFTVGMQLRRFSRTRMTASPRFQGRWAYVGLLERQYTERGRMTGVPTRQGTTYAYPRFVTAPRVVQLGGKTGTGGPPGGPYSPLVFPRR